MPSEPAAQRLVAAHSEIKRACDLLVAPTAHALNSCQDALQHALSELAEYRSQCGEARPDAGTAVVARGVRREVLRAGQLLQNLFTFYRGWERLLGSMSGGYLVGGNPAP